MPVNPKTRGQVVESWEDARALVYDQTHTLPIDQPRIVAPNTTATVRPGDPWGSRWTDNKHLVMIEIALHGHPIIRFYPDRIEFRDAGWKTNTTRDRLNRFLPVGIFQRDHRWYVTSQAGSIYPMRHGCWERISYLKG